MASKKIVDSASLRWPSAPLSGAIEAKEVHVWVWTFGDDDGPAEEDLRILSEQERQRTARFYFVPDRVRYSVCHANMRRILASYLHQSPESLTFRDGALGKPALQLDEAASRLQFNLSHSKTIAALAVSPDSEVGVDVEDIRPIDPGVAKSHFSSVELASLATLEGQRWLNGFYRCWTRKEAILKAEGAGLRIPLDSFDVTLMEDQPAELLAYRPESKLTADWRLYHLSPVDGTMGALAVQDSVTRILKHSL